ncbi:MULTISPECIES: DUF7524 family protein [Halolamina]|uniref:Uncharacterized protein n=1 Tax=Halolamina pelagica TaxID=699431 RepID=A0A1I5QW53_9EURY|nr:MULTISPECIES: hypothetical protein [Halolamina]NHX35575.1 hypothetical protein [Halolamina sp. R1-12]SFP50528.1 hypothetical protein SAMN05216277_104121 [Halolamina pelagica]
MPALSVHLNRDRPRDIDAPASYVADEPFDVALQNHGQGSHVHVRLDESLSRAARLRDDSRYVEADTTARIGVDTQPLSEPVTGRLTVSAGYGAETETVELRIEPSRAGGYGIDVDEELAQPQTEAREPFDAETVGLLVLAVLTLVAAVAVAVLVQSAVVVAAAAFVALVTVVGVVLALT